MCAAEFNTRLFNSESPPDLLKFIVDTTKPELVGDRNLSKARTKVYGILATYISVAGASVADYGTKVRDVCVEALQREVDAKAAVASLAPLTQLVQSYVFDATSLNCEGLFAMLLKMIRVGGSKLSPSLKGALAVRRAGTPVAVVGEWRRPRWRLHAFPRVTASWCRRVVCVRSGGAVLRGPGAVEIPQRGWARHARRKGPLRRVRPLAQERVQEAEAGHAGHLGRHLLPRPRHELLWRRCREDAEGGH